MMKHNYITRILSCLLAAAMIVTLAACGRADNTKNTQTEERQESGQTIAEPAESSTNDKPAETTDTAYEGGSKILIAYFTAAENSGVDAVSSASYTTVNGTEWLGIGILFCKTFETLQPKEKGSMGQNIRDSFSSILLFLV